MAAVKAIEARGLAFSYPDAELVVGPLDWQVEEGAFHLIVGATGSGKTTLLRCLKPALVPAGRRYGSLEVFGRAVDGLDAREAAATVGYVSQSPENQIVCDSVWHELAFGLENLGIAQDTMRRRVAETGHFFGIEPWFRRSVDELSGGQKQMTTLAGTLAMQPRLLVLDEAAHELKCRPTDVAERVATLGHELRETKKALEAATTGAGSNQVAAAYQGAVQLDGYKVVVARLEGLSGKEMRSAWDGIRDAAGGEPVACVIASATPDGKVALLAGGTVAAGFSAGQIIKDVAGLVGGRGGGKANMAQAGGSDASGIDAALDAARATLGIA